MNRHLARRFVRSYSSEHRLILCFILLVSSCVVPITANPLMGDAIFTNVQATDPQFCIQNDITECDMIEQYTGDNGIVDFALFYQPLDMIPGSIQTLYLPITVPDTWVLVGAEACVGQVTVEETGGIMLLTFTFPEGEAARDAFFLMGKLILNVTERGRVEGEWFEYTTYGGGESAGFYYGGRAGYGCGDCAYQCDLNFVCWPVMGDQDIHLSANEGETVVFEFEASASGGACGINFEEDVDWLEMVVEEIEPDLYNLMLTADTSGLAPGIYEGWIEGITSSCSLCRYVIFDVISLSPVNEQSWGRIKVDYR